MLYKASPEFWGIYINKKPYKTIAQIYAELQAKYPGREVVVINGTWYQNVPVKPVGNFKVNGTVLSKEYNECLGYFWSGSNEPVMDWSDMKNCENFICTTPLIYEGYKINPLNYPAEVGGVRGRTGLGKLLSGGWAFICTGDASEPMTPEQLQNRFAALGCESAMMLDSGGSSQMICPDGKVTTSRTIYNFMYAVMPAPGIKINDAGLKWNGAFTKRTLTDEIILHHAAGNGSVEDVHRYHQSQSGYVGIAYNFYVRKDGSIWQGRPEDCAGGHTTNHNFRSVGICAEGNFETETMPSTQHEALKLLVADVKKRYPGAAVIRHGDVNATGCPGKNYPFEYIAGIVSTPPVAEEGQSGVKGFQVWLNSKYGAGLVTDGIYGGKTKVAAVKAYQRELNELYCAKLTVDGLFGAKTRAAVRTLRGGSTGPEVFILQGLLHCSGYDCGALDGICSTNTISAVRRYQAAKGLIADGLAGPNTMTKLMS